MAPTPTAPFGLVAPTPKTTWPCGTHAHYAVWPCGTQGQNVLALWHTGTHRTRLWHPRPKRIWSWGPQGQNDSGPVAPKGRTGAAPDWHTGRISRGPVRLRRSRFCDQARAAPYIGGTERPPEITAARGGASLPCRTRTWPVRRTRRVACSSRVPRPRRRWRRESARGCPGSKDGAFTGERAVTRVPGNR